MIQISHQFAKTLQIIMRLCLNFIELTKTFEANELDVWPVALAHLALPLQTTTTECRLTCLFSFPLSKYFIQVFKVH